MAAEVAYLWVAEQLLSSYAQTRVLRTYWRQRGDHIRAISMCIQRMQKALTQMNVQLANLISDFSGVTGQTIVRAILAGNHDPKKLAALADPRIQASREETAKSQEGIWQPQERIIECDRELRMHLKGFTDKLAGEPPKTGAIAEP
jgi:transposase